MRWSRATPDTASIKLEMESGETAVVSDTIFNAPEGRGSITLKAPPNKLQKHSAKRIKQISRKQEENLAQSLGGERHYGSGNKAGYAGDVRIRGRFRVECKFTSKMSRALTRSEIGKLRSECGLGEAPMINIQFRNPTTLAVEEDWVCVPRSEWEKLNASTDS